jgi:2',3'-cyclic-nucleotide 2'-phosphodiesterase (5'-nucleotidase family)
MIKNFFRKTINHLMKKIILLFVISLLSFSTVFTQDNVKDLKILHWNDFHARNEPYKINKKNDAGETVPVFVGGTASLLGYLNKFRDENSLVLNGGDDFQGSPISSITKGKSQIELLNLFNLDAFVIGNHEFDYGQNPLDSALMGANFEFLSGNLYDRNTRKTFGKLYSTKTINGIKIGIIGVSPIELKSLTLPQNVEALDVLNTDSVITVGISALKNEKCNLIVLLSHNGVEEDSVFASKFHGDIDVIVGGHSHTPIFKPRIVDGTIICQAGSYGRWLGKLDLKVDLDKDTVVKYFGTLTETKMDSAVYDPAAKQKVESMLAAIEPEMKRVIGKLETDWKKSNCGQWTADAIRTKTKTDIAFLNAGSIRKDLPKGDITVGDVWEINPFGNTIMTFKLQGSTIKKMIANNVKMAMKNETLNDYDMIIISGLNVVVDSRLIPENTDAFITSIKVDGKDLDENKTYSASSNSYTAFQMKKYFGEFGEEIKAEDTNILDRDLLLEAIRQQKVINSVFEKRVVDKAKDK